MDPCERSLLEIFINVIYILNPFIRVIVKMRVHDLQDHLCYSFSLTLYS